MRNHFIHILLLIFFLSTDMPGQVTPYLLGDDPSVFESIERLLSQDEIDSVFILSDIILEKSNDPGVKGTAHFYKGQAEAAVRQFALALRSYDTAIQLFKQKNNVKGLAMAYGKKASLYTLQDELNLADTFYDLAIEYAQKERLYGLLIDLYQKRANLHSTAQSSDTAILFLKNALQYAILTEADEATIHLINQISTNYQTIGELDSAILYFQKSLGLKQVMNDSEGMVSDYSALGNLYRERGDYENAQLQLMEALNIAEAEKDSFSMTTVYSELGDIYAAQNIWNVSENYYARALKIAQLKNSRFMEAGCLKKLGYVFQQQKNDSAAVENYESALRLYTQLKNKVNSAEVLVQLSQIYKNESQFENVKTLLQEALETSSRSQDAMSSLSTKLALAEIEIKLGNYNVGIKYAEECLAAYEKMDDKEGLRRGYLLLSEAYSQMGNYQQAYNFHRKYSLVKDSLISVERAETIKKYDLLVTTKKKDTEIAKQNEQIQSQQVALLRKNNQVLLLAGGLGFIGLMAALLFFVYIKNKQLNQQRIHVLKKEKEAQSMKSIIEGEEKERKRFARELHDGLGAVLATVKMQISGIQYKFPEVKSSSTFQKAETLIDDACRTVREVSHDLMPHVLEQQGLVSAIDDMCQNLAGHHDIQFDFIPYGDENTLSDVLKITLFRITQELLKNIIKHAQATEVIVQLTIEDDVIMLIVEDNGVGFDLSKSKKGIGLENIHSRAAYLDGTLEIDSNIGQGSTFTIQLPAKQE